MTTRPDRDAVDEMLKRAERWEPPDGFALRVIAASRSDVRRHTPIPLSLSGIGVTSRLRAWLAAIVQRPRSAIWVLRQYWSLFRGR